LLEVEVGQVRTRERKTKTGRGNQGKNLAGWLGVRGTVERKPWRRRSHLVGRDSEAGANIIGLLSLKK
jgi:hypothetical protein